MIALSRPRPRSITIFAVMFLAAAVLSCIDGLVRIPVTLKSQDAYSWLTRDFLIVWHSAWLSIALIPVAMVWLSALRIARWLVASVTLFKLAGFVLMLPGLPMLLRMQPLGVASLALGVPAAALLFTPASNRWFARKGGEEVAVFE
ncbi:hypothetical protein [Erythrobacter tepidarius]|uniref:hypothetical protein n=1 Tax=Erythrobacter tepidarius TaxID=60454 RepID=UPI000A3AA2B3|nr:hypothetical protein [Erythrobacter tepidarius]